MDWTVKMILLIRKLHELGLLDQYENIIVDFEKFLYAEQHDSVRDHAVWMWTDTLVLIGRPVVEIIEKIKITYDKKYDGEHYNPDRPNIVRALASVLKKYPTNAEALEMIREVCSGYIENDYSHHYEAFIEAQRNLSINLGLQGAFLNALKSKPWYEMIDMIAYFDLLALREIARFSFERIEENLRNRDTLPKEVSLQLLNMNRSIDS